MLESGFVRFRTYDGGESFGALWSARDKVALHDRPLGSRRSPDDCRPMEGEIRCGYDVRRHLFGEDHSSVILERLELRDVAAIEFEGEPLAEHCGGSYIAIVPSKQPSRHYCGGLVLATLYRAGYEPSGLPVVSHAYISRDDSGALRVAIPA